jgi:hypothetical protein
MAYDVARQRVVLFGGEAGNAQWTVQTWLYGDLRPASAQSFGNGCAGTSGTPVLASNLPHAGSPALVLDLRAARASSPCFFGLAAAPHSLQIGNGCTLYLRDPIVALPGATNPFGFATSRLTLPLDPSLRGTALFAQAFVADPQSPPLGLSFTFGWRLALGD